MDELHTYVIRQQSMQVGVPLTFAGGERIVAAQWPDSAEGVVVVTVLVELPPAGA